ncbi:DUF222 domain-containing protein [Brachybacterium huguangmaarense]
MGDLQEPLPLNGPAPQRRPSGETPSCRVVRDPVIARRPVTRESVAERNEHPERPELGGALVELWDLGVAQSRLHTQRLRTLAGFFHEVDPEPARPGTGPADPAGPAGPVRGVLDAPEEFDPRETDAIAVGVALHCTITRAERLIRDAHLALTDLPTCFALLEAGRMPAEWMDETIRRARALTPEDRRRADAVVASWDTGIPPERFRRELRRLVEWLALRADTENEDPRTQRRVDVDLDHAPGLACLHVTGPIPEILSLAQRLDAGARALQDTQRRVLEKAASSADGTDGIEIPGDPEGIAAADGRPLSLAQLRYALLTGAELDTDGVHVPAERFRINLTVPALTLMGLSEQPGMLDGTIPIPADMARALAGTEPTWYRVLTDPATGAFLPLAADRYTPSRAMLEHLRLRSATCAVPGCTRSVSRAAEADHITEYDHENPATGGLTEIENLHLLCREHHRMKTAGLLDPYRLPVERYGPGRTRWRIGQGAGEADPGRSTPAGARDGDSATDSDGDTIGTEPRSDTSAPALAPVLDPFARVTVRDDTDLATPELVARLTHAWNQHLTRDDLHDVLRGADVDAAGPQGATAASDPYDAPPPF